MAMGGVDANLGIDFEIGVDAESRCRNQKWTKNSASAQVVGGRSSWKCFFRKFAKVGISFGGFVPFLFQKF